MNVRLITSLVTTVGLLPIAAAQDPATSTTIGTSSPPPAGPAEAVSRIDQEELETTFTARDLIGKQLVNHAGERLGTINDVALGDDWSQRFDVTRTEAATTDARPEGAAELQVYVSTGGLLGLGGRLGMGADWVRVAADDLLYDRRGDRFILNMPQEQFTAVAEGRPVSQVYTAGEPATSGGTATAPRTIGAGTAASDASREVQDIEEALMENDELRGRARIQVTHSENAIRLDGVVEDAELLRRAGDIARGHTDLEVRNMIEVGEPLATE